MVQRSLTTLLSKIEQDLDRVRTEFLIDIAGDLVESSKGFVDTGAYITSHSITTTRGQGRGRTSHGKPTADPNAKADESIAQLLGDIAAIPKGQTQIYLTNNAPHANIVEYVQGRNVYGSVRNRSGIHLDNAVNRVRGSQ